MKVAVDKELCTGHGRCAVLAGEVYTLDSNGYNADMGTTIDVPAGLEDKAEYGMHNCPEGAIEQIEG